MAKPNYSFEKKQRELAKKQAARDLGQAESAPPTDSDPSSGGGR